MPSEQGESITDDLSDPPTPTVGHFPQPEEEVMSQWAQPAEETPAGCSEFSQSKTMQLEEKEEAAAVLRQAGTQSHIIKNVDEIFLTIEGLMKKLHKLKVSLCQRGQN